MKAELAAGGASAGVGITVADEQLVEVAALAGFGHVMIDGEHGHIGVRECESLVRAAEAAGITPLARVPDNRPEHILRFLDTGVQGVIVPHVSTADDARRAVSSARYYPEGQRGLAGVRSAQFGLAGSLTDYAAEANREVLVIALIEHVEALNNLPEILAVEGLDAVTIGPADLSQSMGYPGERNRPDVSKAIDEIIRQAVAAGVPVGLNCPTGADVREAYAKGVRIFSTSPWSLLAGAMGDYLREGLGTRD